MLTIFGFLCMECTLVPPGEYEPSMCGGNASLCQITLTTCSNYLFTLLSNFYLQSTLNCIIIMVANIIAALLTTMLVEVNDPVSSNVTECGTETVQVTLLRRTLVSTP